MLAMPGDHSYSVVGELINKRPTTIAETHATTISWEKLAVERYILVVVREELAGDVRVVIPLVQAVELASQ